MGTWKKQNKPNRVPRIIQYTGRQAITKIRIYHNNYLLKSPEIMYTI